MAWPGAEWLPPSQRFGASKRIGENYPPASGLRINLYQVADNRCRRFPFLGCHVEVSTRPEDFVASLFFELNLFQDLRCLVEHSQLKIPARRKNMPLPIGCQGIGAS
jgi:hypothetical protein